MDLWPAIDLAGGRAVRLVRGDFAQLHDYGEPLALAHRLASAGATRLHVVDLDAARTGAPVNRGVVTTIASSGLGVRLQVGGGVRSRTDVADLVAAGADRVVIGTTAVEDPEELVRCAEAFPFQVVLGLDYRRGPEGKPVVSTRGWLQASGRSLEAVLGLAEDLPLAGVVVTAIDRDGTMRGPDLGGFRDVLDETALPVIASGGVGNRADLVALGELRSRHHGRALAGVVVGKALLEERIGMKEAIASCAPSE